MLTAETDAIEVVGAVVRLDVDAKFSVFRTTACGTTYAANPRAVAVCGFERDLANDHGI